jgi:hypothetical protein
MYTRDDIRELHDKIRDFEALMKQIPEFEDKMKKTEERLFRDTQKIRAEMLPRDSKISDCYFQIKEFKSMVK